MAKPIIDLRSKLRSYKFDFNLLQPISCSTEDNKAYKKLLKDGQPLPDGVYGYKMQNNEESVEFYTVYETDLTEQEITEYLTYKKLKLLNTIKNCVVFFTVLIITTIIISLILLFKNT